MDQQLEDDEEKEVSLYEDIYNGDNTENKPPYSSKNTITENTKENTKNPITENTKNANTENTKENKNKTETNQKETKKEKTQNSQQKDFMIINKLYNINNNIRNNTNANINKKVDDVNQKKYKTYCSNSKNNFQPQPPKYENMSESKNIIENKDDKDEKILDDGMYFETNKDK